MKKSHVVSAKSCDYLSNLIFNKILDKSCESLSIWYCKCLLDKISSRLIHQETNTRETKYYGSKLSGNELKITFDIYIDPSRNKLIETYQEIFCKTETMAAMIKLKFLFCVDEDETEKKDKIMQQCLNDHENAASHIF